MAVYQEILGLDGETVVALRGPEGETIPLDEGNSDYQAYLAWVENGNTADAASTSVPQSSRAEQVAALAANAQAQVSSITTIAGLKNLFVATVSALSALDNPS